MARSKQRKTLPQHPGAPVSGWAVAGRTLCGIMGAALICATAWALSDGSIELSLSSGRTASSPTPTRLDSLPALIVFALFQGLGGAVLLWGAIHPRSLRQWFILEVVIPVLFLLLVLLPLMGSR